MTQKELLYLEDAIKHEDNLICFLNTFQESLESEDVSSLLDDEAKKHEKLKNEMIELMKEKKND